MAVAIIVAAGRGRRMASRVPKQYLDLDGLPVVAHSLRVFAACDLVETLVLVVPPGDADFCRTRILGGLKPGKRVLLTAGGAERQDSVYRGLVCAAGVLRSPADLVAIHDGVRPLVTAAQVAACIRQALVCGGCILAVPAADTLKRVGEGARISATVAREGLWLAQTPQVFRHDLILDAHEQARRQNVVGTDDAELVERLGAAVSVMTGSRHNFKITTAEDLALARAWLRAGGQTADGA